MTTDEAPAEHTILTPDAPRDTQHSLLYSKTDAPPQLSVSKCRERVARRGPDLERRGTWKHERRGVKSTSWLVAAK